MRLEYALPSGAAVRPLVKHAAFTLLSHRLRSLVSTLGVACGVASFILLLSLGEGARRETLEQLEGLGLGNLVLRAANLSGDQREAAHRLGSRGLTADDAGRLKAALTAVGDVAVLKELQLTLSTSREAPPALAVTPELAAVQSLHVTRGRFIAASDIAGRAQVCVLGSSLASRLGNEGRVGSELRLGASLCRVVGILSEASARQGKGGAVRSRDYDHAILLPLSGTEEVSELVASVRKGEDVVGAAIAVRRVMGVLHHGAGDYQLIVPEELRRQAEASRSTFDLLLGGLSLVCLLMGGIGVMNVMLASVAERTYEVGLRRALGASQEAVLIQFVLEALILTLAGVAIGTAAGLLGLLLFSLFATWAFCLTLWSLAAPAATGVVLGVAFGFYPALRASRLDPIEALRQ